MTAGLMGVRIEAGEGDEGIAAFQGYALKRLYPLHKNFRSILTR